MTANRKSSLETKRAMFRAALAAQDAGELYVSGNRITAALLRTDAVRAVCSHARIDSGRVLEALDDPEDPSFEECERRLKDSLPDLQLPPLDPALKPVFDAVMKRHGQLAISPPALLLEVIRAHSQLAMHLAPHGLTPAAISAGIEKENQ